MTGGDPADPPELSSAELSRLSERLGQLLWAGVILAALFLLAGILLALSSSAGSSVDPSSFGPSKVPWTHLASLGDDEVLAVVGLGLLVATPIGRVVLSLEAFAHARERDYVLVLLAVLVILFASVLVGTFL